MSNATANRAKLRRSQQQERGIARDTGGRRTPGSGSQDHSKGDVVSTEWLIEAKQTTSAGYRLELSTFRGVEVEAIRKDKEPAMVVEIKGRKLAVITYEKFLTLPGAS